MGKGPESNRFEDSKDNSSQSADLNLLLRNDAGAKYERTQTGRPDDSSTSIDQYLPETPATPTPANPSVPVIVETPKPTPSLTDTPAAANPATPAPADTRSGTPRLPETQVPAGIPRPQRAPDITPVAAIASSLGQLDTARKEAIEKLTPAPVSLSSNLFCLGAGVYASPLITRGINNHTQWKGFNDNVGSKAIENEMNSLGQLRDGKISAVNKLHEAAESIKQRPDKLKELARSQVQLKRNEQTLERIYKRESRIYHKYNKSKSKLKLSKPDFDKAKQDFENSNVEWGKIKSKKTAYTMLTSNEKNLESTFIKFWDGKVKYNDLQPNEQTALKLNPNEIKAANRYVNLLDHTNELKTNFSNSRISTRTQRLGLKKDICELETNIESLRKDKVFSEFTDGGPTAKFSERHLEKLEIDNLVDRYRRSALLERQLKIGIKSDNTKVEHWEPSEFEKSIQARHAHLNNPDTYRSKVDALDKNLLPEELKVVQEARKLNDQIGQLKSKLESSNKAKFNSLESKVTAFQGLKSVAKDTAYLWALESGYDFIKDHGLGIKSYGGLNYGTDLAAGFWFGTRMSTPMKMLSVVGTLAAGDFMKSMATSDAMKSLHIEPDKFLQPSRISAFTVGVASMLPMKSLNPLVRAGTIAGAWAFGQTVQYIGDTIRGDHTLTGVDNNLAAHDAAESTSKTDANTRSAQSMNNAIDKWSELAVDRGQAGQNNLNNEVQFFFTKCGKPASNQDQASVDDVRRYATLLVAAGEAQMHKGTLVSGKLILPNQNLDLDGKATDYLYKAQFQIDWLEKNENCDLDLVKRRISNDIEKINGKHDLQTAYETLVDFKYSSEMSELKERVDRVLEMEINNSTKGHSLILGGSDGLAQRYRAQAFIDMVVAGQKLAEPKQDGSEKSINNSLDRAEDAIDKAKKLDPDNADNDQLDILLQRKNNQPK